MCSTTGDVAVRFGKPQDRALQAHVDRMGQCGVIHLGVVAVDLIHPAL